MCTLSLTQRTSSHATRVSDNFGLVRQSGNGPRPSSLFRATKSVYVPVFLMGHVPDSCLASGTSRGGRPLFTFSLHSEKMIRVHGGVASERRQRKPTPSPAVPTLPPFLAALRCLPSFSFPGFMTRYHVPSLLGRTAHTRRKERRKKRNGTERLSPQRPEREGESLL